MKRFGVVGSPVAHSQSPAMFEAAFHALGWRDHRYERIELPGSGKEIVQALRELAHQYDGLNVTAPHKESAFHASFVSDADTSAIRAVNVLYRREGEGGWGGESTDLPALILELSEWLKPALPRTEVRRAIVLGGGGMARTAVQALLRKGVECIEVRVRGSHSLAPSASWTQGIWGAPLPDDTDLVVQATSDGNAGVSDGKNVLAAMDWSARSEARPFVYESIYSPSETPILALAKSRGYPFANGRGLLLGQAVLAFQRWFGVEAPEAAMRAALEGV
ncbi:MAG: hypothetical protein KBF88_00635 [Polyangiaceae bacterium]|nr:hypothetical protein [Polyangiaceae bacterium]